MLPERLQLTCYPKKERQQQGSTDWLALLLPYFFSENQWRHLMPWQKSYEEKMEKNGLFFCCSFSDGISGQLLLGITQRVAL
jgi:hypothetical protein